MSDLIYFGMLWLLCGLATWTLVVRRPEHVRTILDAYMLFVCIVIGPVALATLIYKRNK